MRDQNYTAMRFIRAGWLARGALVGVCVSVVILTWACVSIAKAAFTEATQSAGSSLSAADCFTVTEIDVGNFYYNPDPVTIGVGCTVRWTVSSNSQHTTTSNTGLWDSGALQSGQSFSYTFTSAGTYLYGCQIHTGKASQQNAQIVVE